MIVLSAPSAFCAAKTRETGSKRLARLPSSTAGSGETRTLAAASLLSKMPPPTLPQKPSSRLTPTCCGSRGAGTSHWVLSLTADSSSLTGELRTSLSNDSCCVALAMSLKRRTPMLSIMVYQTCV
ncbi:ATPase [Pseudomonas syringae pv. spinaceae]|uniref:ATPase n=1 Tax=Pseudomonas syringae pv. spinaceae TaxID=264459 RepID=A0A0Q0BGR8_PSESX|nr:ATPase [Pseudomonas syringae pv. spinaceae]